MIRVHDLTKRYGPIEAVSNLSFEISKGEIVGFLGPNGAGKTTTMRILTGFIPATSGSAVIAGYDVSQEPLQVKRRIGYLPENVPLYPEMRVISYLAYAAEIKGIARPGRKREIARVIDRCGIAEIANRTIRHISKGYRQRVGLAHALIGNPPVLILDEPTVGLDPKQIISIRQTIKELAGDHTVLLSTHILPEVAMICSRVLILNRGRIVGEESMSDLGGGRTLEEVFLEAISAESEASA